MTHSPVQHFTPSTPCPVCGSGTGGCSRTADGLFICRKQQGPVPGFHYLGQAEKDDQWALYRLETDSPPKPGSRYPNGHPINWPTRAEQYAQAFTPEVRRQLAEHLQLPEVALYGHDIGYLASDPHGPCWTFPERDGTGRIIGIGRRYADGSKASMPGGHRGLFMPSGWDQRDGPVFCPEGASDTLALTALGLAAVGRPSCTAGVDQLATLFQGLPKDREIVIVGEHDTKPDGAWPGKEGAIQTARRLADKLGRPVQWVLPPQGRKDCRVWVQAKRLSTTGEACRDDWEELGQQLLTDWSANYQAVQPQRAVATAGLATTCLASIQPQPVRWLVPKYFPQGKMVLVAGDGGLGKSLIALDLSAAVTTGRAALGLDYAPPDPAEVLLVCCEDDFADTVVPRLLAAGADLHRIHKVDGVRGADGRPYPFSLAHLEQIEQELQGRPGIRLVVIDPAAGYVGRAGKDGRNNGELRALLDPLAELAARCNVTVLLIAHCGKGPREKAVHKVLDSVGWVNSVRAAFLVAPDPADDLRRLFLHLKGNLLTRPPGLAFRLNPLDHDQAASVRPALCHLDAADQEELLTQVPKVEWLGEVSITADEVAAQKSDDGPVEADEAAEWLLHFLAEFAYPSQELIEAGARAGYPRKALFNAKKRLKGQVRASNKGAFQGTWCWGIGPPESWTLRPQTVPRVAEA